MKLMKVADGSQVAEARRESQKVGKALGMSEHDLGRVAIVATEMASNQLKHAGGGRFSRTESTQSMASEMRSPTTPWWLAPVAVQTCTATPSRRSASMLHAASLSAGMMLSERPCT